MKSIKLRRVLSALLASLLVLSALSGCKKPGSLEIEVDKTITDKNLTYTLYANGMGVYDDSHEIVKKWEEMFNVQFKFDGSGTDWMETMALLANANDMPELFFFVQNDTNYMEAYVNMVKKGLVTPISEYVTEEETPNLYALLSCDNFQDLKIDGKFYFIPAPNTAFDNTIYVRQDWLDKLGMKQPTTIEEFEEMLRAFTQDDPDGNGKNDTYGMAASKVFDWLSYFKIGFGCEPGWSKDANGEWQLDAFTEPYKEYLTWMASLYQKGYLKNEFFLYEDSDAVNDFYNGKCGCMLYNGGRTTGGITFTIAKLDANAVVDVLPMPDGAARGGYLTNGDWWGGWSIAYDAEEPYRLVKFLDYMYSEEGSAERLYGIKGVHYDLDENGEIVPNFEARIASGGFGISEDGKPRDLFNIGAHWGGRVKLEDNHLVDYTSKSIFREPELAEKSLRYSQQNLKRNFPTDTLSLGIEYATIYSRVYDRILTYSIRIISGSATVEAGLAKMREMAESDGYAKLQKIIADRYD